MISPIDNNDVSDARLVAYIDGELSPDDRAVVARALDGDPDLRQRLEFLDTGARPFGEAFDLLLEAAPDAQLQAMFASLVDGAGTSETTAADDNVLPFRRPAPPGGGMRHIWQIAAAASIALTVFGGGVITGSIFAPEQPPTTVPVQPPTTVPVQTQTPPTQAEAQRTWMEAVAQYVSLFSEHTLAGMPADTAARDAGLRRVSTALGIDLSPDKVAALPSLDFKGTQLLQLAGKPLAQVAFLSDTGKPVAICIIKSAKQSEPPAADRRHGLNIVHWVANGYGFMVIGDVPADALQRISREAAARLS